MNPQDAADPNSGNVIQPGPQNVQGLLGGVQQWPSMIQPLPPASSWAIPQLFQLPASPILSNDDYMARYFNLPLTYGYGANRFLLEAPTTLPPVYIPPPEYRAPTPPPVSPPPVVPPPAVAPPPPVAPPPEGGMPPPPDQGEIQLPVLPPIEPVLPPEEPELPAPPPLEPPPPPPPIDVPEVIIDEPEIPVIAQPPIIRDEEIFIPLPPYERGEIPVPMIKEPGKRPVIEVRVKDPETGEIVETSTERPYGTSGPSVIPIPTEIPTEVPGIEVPEIPPLELPAMPPVEQAAPPAYIGDELMPPDESEFAVYGDIMKDYTGPGLTDGPDLYGRPVLPGDVGGDIIKGYEGPGIEEIPGVFAAPDVIVGQGDKFVGPVEEPFLGYYADAPGFTEPVPSSAISFPVKPQGEVIESKLPSIADQELAAAGLPGLLESPVVQELATSGLLDIPIESLPPEVVQAILDDVMMYGEA